MPVKKLVQIVFPLLFIFSVADAQKVINLDQHTPIKKSDKILYGDTPAERTEKVEGTPYLNENFVTGVVYSYYEKYEGVLMRYNIYDDNIEFKQDDQLLVFDPQPKIMKIDLDQSTFVVDSYEQKGKIRLGFFILLDSGKIVLLSKNRVTYKEQQQPRALDATPPPARYTRAPDDYFYRIGNGVLIKVENIKKMITGFPDKHMELTEFAKKEKISTNKEDELIKLVRYYNAL